MPKSPHPHGQLHLPGAVDDLYAERGSLSVARIESLGRANVASQVATAGQIWFSYFTAPVTLTISKVLVAGGGTAETGATKVRIALCTVDGSGNLATVFATADLSAATDATNASAVYFQSSTKLWSCPLTLQSDLSTALANYTLVRGQRYAWSFLQVTAGTSGTLLGVATLGPIMALPPIEAGVTTGGKTDLAASYTAGQSTVSAVKHWMAGIP